MNCLFTRIFYDFRLTRAYITPRIDQRISETEAGRRFLEKLRENHDDDDVRAGNDGKRPSHGNKPSRRSGSRTDVGGSGTVSSLHVPLLELKRKQSALRASLEELIVEYLRGLTADSEPDLTKDSFQHSRVRRSSRRQRVEAQNANPNVNHTEANTKNIINDIEIDVLTANDVERRHIQLASGNLSDLYENSEYINDEVPPATLTHIDDSVGKQKDQTVCGNQKRRVVHFDREVLDSVVENESDYEHNIRRLLNYR